MTDRKLNILISGLGSIGQRHARNLRSLLGENLNLTAFRVNKSVPLLSAESRPCPGDLEHTLGIKSFQSLDEALSLKPDAIIITNPSSEHLKTALAAARAGINLFIEKPLSHSMENVSELIKIVADKNLIAFVAYQFRFSPLLIKLREWINQEKAGQLLFVSCNSGEYLPDWHPYEDYHKSYAANQALGGGVTLTQIHDLDYLGWIFGWPLKVFSCGKASGTLGIDADDAVSSMLITEHKGRELPMTLSHDYHQRPARRCCEVTGNHGRIIADIRNNKLSFINNQGIEESEQYASTDRNELYLNEMSHFLECLRKKSQPCVGLHEGAKSLAVACAIHQSIKSELPETIKYI